MLRIRVIPALLLSEGGLVKTVKFKKPTYVGDPINAVRIFNEKEVDEIVFFDITATPLKNGPDFELLEDIAGETFMPFGYGGGITNIEQVRRLFALGCEKVILNSILFDEPELLSAAVKIAGSANVVVSVDVKKNWLGSYSVWSHCGAFDTKLDPVAHCQNMVALGAGEIILNTIDQDGVMGGYDLNLINRVTAAVNVPVVTLGGAGNLDHLSDAVEAGASAVAAGSMFVFHGRHKAVLITYPSYSDLEDRFASHSR